MHVELSNGQSAELRDISTLTEGDAEDLNAAIYDLIPRDDKDKQLPFNPMRFSRGQERAVLKLVLESWTLGIDVPSELDGFRALSVDDARILRDATAQYREALTPNFSPSHDEGSPTPPSAA